MEHVISFARGVPAPECLAEEELADCARAVLERDGKTILSYGSGGGYAPLRDLIAERLGVDPTRVILTNGALQGFVLLAQHFGPGATVLVEHPTYDRPLKILRELGADRRRGARWTTRGSIPDALERRSRRAPDPAFLYTIPTFQNPSGRTLPTDRRRRVVELADATTCSSLEDDPYGLIRFEGEARAVALRAPGGTIIYTLVVLEDDRARRPRRLVRRPRRARGAAHRAAPTRPTSRPALLGEAVVYEFVSRGQLRAEPRAGQRPAEGSPRRDARRARQAPLRHHVVASRAAATSSGSSSPRAPTRPRWSKRAEGVTAVLGTDFGGAPNTLRLAYSFVSPDEIDEGVARLAAAL